MSTRSKPASSCARENSRTYAGSTTGPFSALDSDPAVVAIIPSSSMGISDTPDGSGAVGCGRAYHRNGFDETAGVRMLRFGDHASGRPVLDDLTLAQHHEPVTHR